MTSALLAGLTGLRANQNYLNVIGNNLANSNTPGYKSSRVTFSDILSQTIRSAASPSSSIGGTNPIQIGRGAEVASVDQNFSQGSLLNTGRNLDLGIQGNGFFVLSDGANTYYTRVGTFGLDSGENLVDTRSGLKVQSADGGDIKVQLNSVVPPDATDAVNFRGNLPALGPTSGPTTELWESDPFMEVSQAVLPGTGTPTSGTGGSAVYTIAANSQLIINVGNAATQTFVLGAGDMAVQGSPTAAEIVTALNARIPGITASVTAAGKITLTSHTAGLSARIQVGSSTIATALGFSTTAVTGGETPATATTDLNNLKNNTVPYQTGDRIRIYGSKGHGTNVDRDFVYGVDGQTIDDLVNFANGLFQTEATLTMNSAGKLSLAASAAGDTSLSLTFLDRPSSTGHSNFALNGLTNTTIGRDPDKVSTVASVYDSLGQLHEITFDLTRQTDGSWDMTATLAATEGTLAATSLGSLTFDTDGRLPPSLSSTLDVTWANGAAPQTMNLQLGATSDRVGLTQFGGRNEVFSDADGFPAGTLSDISIESNGQITGRFSNGQTRAVDQLQLALFSNPAGLERSGNGHFVVSSNSGNPQLTTAGNGSSGQILSGSLEGSNVDVAEEFVRLIEAQRGFQANARIISTSDQVLAELVNLGR